MIQPQWGEHITVAADGHVATITLDRPANNHVSVGLMRDLADALDAIDQDPDLRCSVLQTAGKAFCAGADFADSKDEISSSQDGVLSLYEQATRLFGTQKPIVAAVQGAAVGAGLGLALVADFRVAAPEARFSANFVKLGYYPGFGLTHTLPRLVGLQAASLLFLTGRRVKGDEALAMGLVDVLAPLETLRAEALALAREIAENAPLSIIATRKALRGDLAEAVRAQTRIENREQGVLRVTEDFAEGLRAVAERRTGNFVGR